MMELGVRRFPRMDRVAVHPLELVVPSIMGALRVWLLCDWE